MRRNYIPPRDQDPLGAIFAAQFVGLVLVILITHLAGWPALPLGIGVVIGYILTLGAAIGVAWWSRP